ncbi:hypothetical protein F4801DRAFT_584033 [Xylaria longipes]|nr:hypothetical protein F4801DRAFT_584033 [Xylaria longipes]
MRLQIIVAAVVNAAAVAKATAHANRPLSIRSELPEGYKVEPMTWRGAIEEGGPEVSFSGTIEEVTRQIQAVKRDFMWESLRSDSRVSLTPLEKRDKASYSSSQPGASRKAQHKPKVTRANPTIQAGIICGVGGEDAATYGPLTPNVEDSRDKISKMAGTCAVAGGPRVCSVITCTRNAAVWLCNDNAAPIAPSCDYLASYVDDIIGTCGQDYDHGHRFCRGQIFDTDSYNVVVGWESQC